MKRFLSVLLVTCFLTIGLSIAPSAATYPANYKSTWDINNKQGDFMPHAGILTVYSKDSVQYKNSISRQVKIMYKTKNGVKYKMVVEYVYSLYAPVKKISNNVNGKQNNFTVSVSKSSDVSVSTSLSSSIGMNCQALGLSADIKAEISVTKGTSISVGSSYPITLSNYKGYNKNAYYAVWYYRWVDVYRVTAYPAAYACDNKGKTIEVYSIKDPKNSGSFASYRGTPYQEIVWYRSPSDNSYNPKPKYNYDPRPKL